MEHQRKKLLQFGLVVPLFLSGCQTASLEDAADSLAPVSEAETTTISADAAGETDAATSAPTPVTRPNPGIASVVPIEKAAPVEEQDFVASGARRTGQFPSFGQEPAAANSQMSEAERISAEAEMTELLKARASSADGRAQYEARLRQLRALADSHAGETQAKIEN